jgi:hypothetical protein
MRQAKAFEEGAPTAHVFIPLRADHYVLDSIAPFDWSSRFMMASSGFGNILEGMTAIMQVVCLSPR